MEERPNSLEAKKLAYIKKSFLAGLKSKTSSRKRNPYISQALYNAFDRLKRRNNSRTRNRNSVTANRGTNLKSRSANRRAALNAKNKEKEKLMQKIKKRKN